MDLLCWEEAQFLVVMSNKLNLSPSSYCKLEVLHLRVFVCVRQYGTDKAGQKSTFRS